MSGKLVRYGYRLPHGKTIREEIWDELDQAMDRLMDDKPRSVDQVITGAGELRTLSESATRFLVDKWQDYGRDQGKAEALAYVIALFERPDHPDIESVKGAAVMRYKERKEAGNNAHVDELARDMQGLDTPAEVGE